MKGMHTSCSRFYTENTEAHATNYLIFYTLYVCITENFIILNCELHNTQL